MDADGTEDGFDLELLRLVRAEVTIPVIASGGAGAVEHFPPAVAAGADAVLAAMRAHPQGSGAAIVGECVAEHPGMVVVATGLGGTRVVDLPLGEQLPRIC